jgi:hypothetical protein
MLIGWSAQSQTCDSILLAAPFGATQPVGWTGDFNMLGGGLAEGWLTSTGPSSAAGTGPQAPFAGTHYAYMESSGPAGVNSTYSLQTPSINMPADGQVQLNLSYLMYGSDIGSFNIEVLQGATTDTIFRRTGQQHADGAVTSWEAISADLSTYAGTSIRIQFTGMKMVSGLGDIAIDEVQVCYTPISRVPTLGTWALICLGLLMLILGLAAIQESVSRTEIYPTQ